QRHLESCLEPAREREHIGARRRDHHRLNAVADRFHGGFHGGPRHAVASAFEGAPQAIETAIAGQEYASGTWHGGGSTVRVRLLQTLYPSESHKMCHWSPSCHLS